MSRWDAIGLFWEEYQERQTRQATASAGRSTRPLAAIPEPQWAPPRDFPNLAAASALIIDVETYDPNLRSAGPGDIRGDGELVGIAVGTDDGARWYFPMRHRVQREMNLEPEAVLAWARDQLTRPGQLKIGANLLYDLFWLAAEGVHVPGPYIDVQWVEAVINESAPTMSLDALGQRYCGEGKETPELYQWCAKSYGGEADGRQRANIYRAPPSLVGPYAESDVDLPWRVWQEQRKVIERWDRDAPVAGGWGVGPLLDVEHRLMPMLVAMRRRGIRVDRDEAQRLDDTLAAKEQAAQGELDRLAGVGRSINVYTAHDIAAAMDRAGVEYPRTAKGNPSFTKEWLEACEHPVAEQVLAVRKYGKARTTFVQGYVLDGEVNGRVHPQLHPLRGDENGAVSGRFASSNPNIQNIPARDPELGPLIRGLFKPEEGCRWRSDDYSQIEFRMLAQMARGPGADEVRRRYREEPDTDFHDLATNLIREVAGVELGRKPTKNINFGLVFGMGKRKLTRSLGVSEDRGVQLFESYHEGLPFVRSTMDLATKAATRRGYVRTLGGRIARFDTWEPRDWDLRQAVAPRTDRDKVLELVTMYRDAARREGERVPKPGVVRAHTHKALNRILQGSAADLIKKAMVDIWESGVCDVLGPPHNQVHDELNWSDPGTPEAQEAVEEAHRLMTRCWPSLQVPIATDSSVGPDWGGLSNDRQQGE